MVTPRTTLGRELALAIHGLGGPGEEAILHPRDAIRAIEDEACASLGAIVTEYLASDGSEGTYDAGRMIAARNALYIVLGRPHDAEPTHPPFGLARSTSVAEDRLKPTDAGSTPATGHQCIFPGCTATSKHYHGGFPGGYDNPDDPEGLPIEYADDEYNGRIPR